MEDYTTASAAAANSNAAILQRLLLAQQQQQQALKNAANQNTTVAANALLLEQIRRSQLAAAAAGVLGSGNVQVGSGSGSALWEQQQRQMLLLLLQQQRQQNMQQYLQAIALANLNNKVAVNASLDAAALRVHQQQQLQALNALLANANCTAASANPDFRLPTHNLAPVSAHKRGNSIDGGSSPLRNSPRAVHEFSTSWPASECDSPTSPAASAFADSADSFEPLPSEEEFEMHLMTVQTSYFSQE